MRILIATGIYPPKIGGPATYALNLKKSFEKLGHQVFVKTYALENSLPSVIRHIYFFLKSIPAISRSDFVLGMDTFSVGLPAMLASMLLGKKFVLRIGGDFLWESFVERTKTEVSLNDFYKKDLNFSFKEKVIFKLTKYLLKKTDIIVFSTKWQASIWQKPYDLEREKVFVIDNYFAPQVKGLSPVKKNFISAARKIFLKNGQRLNRAFEKAKLIDRSITLDTETCSHKELMQKIQSCYAVILPSFGEVSPNLILEAISFGKPFIVTKENGLAEKLSNIALFVDPFNEDDIAEKISFLSKDSNYQRQLDLVSNFSYVHTWDDIAMDFLDLVKNK